MAETVKWLHLCRKAGALATGDSAVREALAGGHARLVLLAGDAGEVVARRTRILAESCGCPVAEAGMDKFELGGALGRRAVSVAAVVNGELAAAILRNINN